MIPFLRDNSVVFLGLLSWFIAQLIKFIIEVSTHRRINWRRFFESGGMPSSRSCAPSPWASASGRASRPAFLLWRL